MKLYKIFLICIILSVTGFSNAQNLSEKDKMALAIWIPDGTENLTPAAKSVLQNKLTNIATENGIVGSSEFQRFVMAANVNVISKNITSTAPVMQAYTLSVDLYIGDGIDGKAFSSYSITVKGVGENETKAYIAALKNIQIDNPTIQSFIGKGKSKIVAYYNTQCDFIITKAKTLANQNKFDEALWYLTTIPDECSDCWKKAMDAASLIFKQKINVECKQKLNEANNIWNAAQNWEAAQEAGRILSSIDPNADCVDEIKTLANKIEKRIKEVDNREWNFRYDYEIGLKRDLIKAYQEVGVAWGNGQAQNVTYKSMW